MDIDLSTGAPPSPGRTLKLAETLPDIMRTLNHQTMHHEALEYPAELDKLIRAAEIMVQRLPQLLTQAVRWVVAEHDAGRIEVSHGEWPGRPAAAVVALQVRRDGAIAAAEDLQAALAGMAQVTSCLEAAETGEDGGDDA